MSKKLSNIFFASFILLIVTNVFNIVSTFTTFNGFSVFNSVSDVIFNLDNSFLFSVEATSSVDTEVVARRVGSGLATAGLGGVGTGIGLVFSGLIKGFSRNPSLKDDLFSYAIFGFALTEAIGLFALMMAFMLLYA
jgi:F-type H+-transporting ATPase subunit c